MGGQARYSSRETMVFQAKTIENEAATAAVMAGGTAVSLPVALNPARQPTAAMISPGTRDLASSAATSDGLTAAATRSSRSRGAGPPSSGESRALAPMATARKTTLSAMSETVMPSS